MTATIDLRFGLSSMPEAELNSSFSLSMPRDIKRCIVVWTYSSNFLRAAIGRSSGSRESVEPFVLNHWVCLRSSIIHSELKTESVRAATATVPVDMGLQVARTVVEILDI